MMKSLDRPSTPSLSLSTPDAVQAADSIRVLTSIVWVLIGLVFLVVGAYAALAHPPVPQQLEIRPDPDFHPLPVPAPVGPVPADAELIASAR
jgi:hypothetical protein